MFTKNLTAHRTQRVLATIHITFY